MEEQQKKRSPELQGLIDTGESLKKRILDVIQQWPVDEKGIPLDSEETSPEYKENWRIFVVELRRWFNAINQQVMPKVLDSKQSLHDIRDSILIPVLS